MQWGARNIFPHDAALTSSSFMPVSFEWQSRQSVGSIRYKLSMIVIFLFCVDPLKNAWEISKCLYWILSLLTILWYTLQLHHPLIGSFYLFMDNNWLNNKLMGGRYWKSCEEVNLPRVKMMDTDSGSETNCIEAVVINPLKKPFRGDHPIDTVI